MPSGSSTRARRGFPRRSSRGLPDEVIAARSESRVQDGLWPALAAVRVRLGLVEQLVATAAACWWLSLDEMHQADGGPWTSLGTLPWFVGVWIVMMAAMLFPSVAPPGAL